MEELFFVASILGIDFGSDTSAISYMTDTGKIKVFTDENDLAVVNSSLNFLKNKILLGNDAIQAKNHTLFYDSYKRNIGNDEKFIDSHNESFSVEELSAILLSELKKRAEHQINEKISEVVLSVPTIFNSKQRNNLKNSAKLAGLNAVRLVNDSTADILYYVKKNNIRRGKILAIDIGEEFLDISLADTNDGLIEIVRSYGDYHKCGHTLTKKIQKWIIQNIELSYGNIIDKKDVNISKRISYAAKKAKEEITQKEQLTITLPLIGIDAQNKPVNVELKFTREIFNSLAKEAVNNLATSIEEIVKKIGLNKNEIDSVLLNGGNIRIPVLKKILFKRFEDNKTIILDQLAVVKGTAIEGAIISNMIEDTLLLDVLPHSLGIRDAKNKMDIFVSKNSVLPTENNKIFTTSKAAQSKVSIDIYEGEHELAQSNMSLGYFTFKQLIDSNIKQPKIEIIFKVNINGSLTVIAKDTALNRKQTIVPDNLFLVSETDLELFKKKLSNYKDINEETAKQKNVAQKLIKNHSNIVDLLVKKNLQSNQDKLCNSFADLKKAYKTGIGLDIAINNYKNVLNDSLNNIFATLEEKS